MKGEQKQVGHRLPPKDIPAKLRPTNTTTKMTTALQYEGDTETAQTRALDLLKLVAKKIASNPATLQFKQRNIGLTVTLIEIHADASNYGSVNGRGGTHLHALQAIAKVFSDRNHMDVQVRLMEMPGGTRQQQPRLVPRDDWKRDEFRDVMQTIFQALFNEAKAVVSDIGNGESIVEVFVGPTDKESTAEWLKQKMSPVVQHMAALYHRKIQILAITQVPNVEAVGEQD